MMIRFSRTRFLIGLVAGVVVAAGVLGCARLYLTSKAAADVVASKLEDFLGVPVRIDEVDVGMRDASKIERLKIYEGEGQRPDTPWLTVEHTDADLSAFDVVGGDTLPRSIVLTGAVMELRFDADGHLLTKLPKIKPSEKPFPQLVLRNARVIIDQEGHPEQPGQPEQPRRTMEIENVNAEGGDANGVLEFHGTATDKSWGDWTIAGSFKSADGLMKLNVKAPPVKVTQKKLEAVPFVSMKVWEHVKLDGYTPVNLDMEFTVGQKGGHYRLELEPTKTDVFVTSIKLHADGASGKVIVEDRLVQLRNVTGRTADGTIDLPYADLDFRYPTTELMFPQIAVKRVNVNGLPESWGIKKVPVKYPMLTGQASLRVAIKNGKAQTTGAGDGKVEVLNSIIPVPPVKVHMDADGEHFHFTRSAI
jgi:hypothetical protein